uniref:Methyltransferase domain-containing protein n=1 Tax=viral metagenome TaxID=1070528 RepID=A0A6C0B434_9ZZZZ
MKLKLLFKKFGVLYVFIFTICVQAIVTYAYTKTKKFSLRALVRNLSVSFSLYFAYTTKNYFLLFIPLVLEGVLETLKYKGYHMEPYIATEYQYSDFWNNITKKNQVLSNFSEANFDEIIGFDTKDISSENNKKIYDWCKKTYLESINNPNAVIYDVNNEKLPEASVLKKTTDDRKFELICKKLDIKPGMKILEIGFGDGDFMDYIYEHYELRPTGLSISNEQVKRVKKKGFEAFHMNSWDITPEKIGTYDIIIQCGNLEYILTSGKDHAEHYKKYSNIIKSVLNPTGKYFITACHYNTNFIDSSSIFNYSSEYLLRMYFLWAGNDGWYPFGTDGFSKYANEVGLKTLFHQDRTHDYYITMNMFFSYFQCQNGSCLLSFSFASLLDAMIKTIAGPYYIHTYLCYLATNDYIWTPFLWEFVPQNINGKWIPPFTLQYIMFQN